MPLEKKEEKAPAKLRRDKDPNYVWNPETRRWIHKQGRVYQKMLLDRIAGVKPDSSSSVIASGTPEEMRVMYEKLKDNKQLVGYGKELLVKGGNLCVVRRKVNTLEIQRGIRDAQRDVVLENRELLSSDLTDDQMKYLLGRLVDLKLMGKSIDVKAEVNQLLGVKEKLQKPKSTEPAQSAAELFFEGVRSPRPVAPRVAKPVVRRVAPENPPHITTPLSRPAQPVARRVAPVKKWFKGSFKPPEPSKTSRSKFTLASEQETDWDTQSEATEFDSEFD